MKKFQECVCLLLGHGRMGREAEDLFADTFGFGICAGFVSCIRGIDTRRAHDAAGPAIGEVYILALERLSDRICIADEERKLLQWQHCIILFFQCTGNAIDLHRVIPGIDL